MSNNNEVILENAVVAKQPTYSHTFGGESFFKTEVGCKRLSGFIDRIPVIFSEKVMSATDVLIGCHLKIRGTFCSKNVPKDDGRSHVELYVLCSDIEFSDEVDFSEITLDGYICKRSNVRETLKGRRICDVVIATNRRYGGSDYIPCIVWGSQASYVEKMDIGSNVKLKGRIQSREYEKLHLDGTKETRTAYEVSVHRIEKGEDM